MVCVFDANFIKCGHSAERERAKRFVFVHGNYEGYVSAAVVDSIEPHISLAMLKVGRSACTATSVIE